MLHVASDPKFLTDIERFAGPRFRNEVAVYGPGFDPGLRIEGREPIRFRSGRHAVRGIAELASGFDLLVVHNLDYWKARAVARIRGDVPIGWRFFGFELYNRWSEELYSARTRELLARERGWRRWALDPLRPPLRKLLRWDHVGPAVKRIDLFFGIIPDEYELLTRRTGLRLPEFVQFPVKSDFSAQAPNVASKRDIVLLGNSRNPYNNHLDVLDAVLPVPEASRYRIVIPFSYGADGLYASEIRATVRDHDVELVERFQPRHEFRRTFAEARAAVYAGRRQMALWNIFASLAHGVKVYLHPHNPTYDWLIRSGARVHDVARFVDDVRTGDLGLSQAEANQNWSIVRRLASEDAVEAFQREISARITPRPRSEPTRTPA